MKKMLLLALAAIFTCAFSIRAQTVDDIVNKHIAAMGGKTKLNAIKSVTLVGTMETYGKTIPFKLTIINKRGLRVEFEAENTNNIQVSTTTGGWTMFGVRMQTEPTDVSADDLKGIGPQIDLEGELVNAKAKGHTMGLIGKETENNVEMYKIRLTRKDSTIADYFLDAKSYYIVKMASDLGAEKTVSTLSDFRKTDDGYTYASVTNTEPSGVKMMIAKMTFNPPVDEKIFEKPMKTAAKPAE